MEDRGMVRFLYPISYLLSSAEEAALPNGAREELDWTDFQIATKER
jgi:hypothetical protein